MQGPLGLGRSELVRERPNPRSSSFKAVPLLCHVLELRGHASEERMAFLLPKRRVARGALHRVRLGDGVGWGRRSAMPRVVIHHGRCGGAGASLRLGGQKLAIEKSVEVSAHGV
eukprot:843041-Rhodomonas_salina.2